MPPETDFIPSNIVLNSNEIRELFGESYHGAINYILDYLDPVKTEVAIKNIVSAIAEHVFAESNGLQEYSGTWENGSLMFFGYNIEQALTESIENSSGQIPDFEIARNIKNLNFYNKLKNHRNSGNNATFVEFSPSPPNISDPEVVKRGYKGMDTIFVYNYQDNGTERITQYWFPQTNIADYKSLFLQLGITIDSENPVDLEVMNLSGAFSDSSIDVLNRLIQNQQERIFDPIMQSQLIDYLKVIEQEIICFLEAIKSDLTVSKIEETLKELVAIMTQSQLKMRLFILNTFNINTLSEDQNARYNALLHFHKDNPLNYDQQGFANAIGYEITGCGFGPALMQSQNIINYNPAFYFGRSGGIISSALDFNELYVFICPNCQKWHAIDVPNNIFIEKCSCGFDAKCNHTNKVEPFELANVA